MADALNNEVGAVIPQMDEATALANLTSILGEDRQQVIMQLSRRSFSKHMYLTTKYDLGSGVAAQGIFVETKKLQALPAESRNSITAVCDALHDKGYRNIYNPY